MTRLAALAVAVLPWVAACRVSELALSPPAPAIDMSVGSTELDLPQGLAVLTVANVSRSGGFAGDVVFTVDGAPPGLRAVVSGPETAAGVTSVLVSVGSDRDFPTGRYPLTVRANGNGVHESVGLLNVTVTPAGSGVYALEVRPISVMQGSQVTVLLSINRADFFNTPVRTTVEHVPAGVTATVYPEENVKAVSSLTVAVARSLSPGQYSITVRGTAAGLADRLETVPLIVLAAQP